MARAYTKEQIAEALVVVEVCQGNVRYAEYRTGIPRRTIRSWMKGQRRITTPKDHIEMEKLRKEKKGDLAAAFEDIAWKCVTRLTKSQVLEECKDPLKISSVAGPAVDKMRLMRGEATAITETRRERHQWAESKIQEIMRTHKLTREEALEVAKEQAPTVFGLLSGEESKSVN
jgi:hypothetical protein